MTYYINAAIPALGTSPQIIAPQEKNVISSINKVAFFTFSSLATFFAISSLPLMPIGISITVSVLVGAILITNLTSSPINRSFLDVHYTPIPLHYSRMNHCHYRPFCPQTSYPRFHSRPCHSEVRRDQVGERGDRVHCRPVNRPFQEPHFFNRERDAVGERSSF